MESKFIVSPAAAPSGKAVELDANVIGRMARDLTAFFKLASRINSILDPESLQQEVLKLICEVVPAEQGACLIVHPRSREITAVTNWQRQPGELAAIQVDQ